MTNFDRRADFPVRHLEFNGHSKEDNGGLENPPSGEGDAKGVLGMSEWQTKRLGDILQLNYGKSLPVKNRIEGAIPVYGSNGIVGSHNKAIVNEAGLIIGRKGSAGQVHQSRGPFCPIDTTFYITAADAPDIDLEFLFYLLRHIDLTRIIGDVGVPGLNREMAYMEPVHVPTAISEQKKIAHILLTVQRAIEAQERIIQTTTELKKALMHKLFTEGLRNEPQKETEIGLVPESWELLSICDLFQTQLGKMLSQKSKVGNSPKVYLRNKNVQWGRIDTEDLLEMDFNDREAVKFQLQKGDLLVCEGGEVGRAALWDGSIAECYYQKALHRLRPKTDQITNEFMLHWMRFAFQLTNTYGVTGTRTTIAHLPEIKLKPLLVPVPPTEEQTEMIYLLNSADQKHSVHQRKKFALQELFRILLQELMTAKTLVHEMEVIA